MKSYLLPFLILLICSCTMSKNNTPVHEKKPQDPDRMKMAGEIVEHQFLKKNGEPEDFTELYFRASVQDYFIKFCESNVKKEDLTPFIGQVVRIEAQILNGNWDSCSEDEHDVQSRVGAYIILKKLN